MVESQLGHYTVLERIGAGGLGEVYRAQDTKLGRDVALKVLFDRATADSDQIARLRQEARAVAAINHPNIVTLYSVEDHEGVTFLTMEMIEGKTLDEVAPPEGLALGRFFDYALSLADALAVAHDNGIIHRDLKPGNIMITREGRPKILDFGLARLAEPPPGLTDATQDVRLTREGAVLGTVPYMSPEQLRGEPADARSDIFSLGIVLYELLTGSRPFQGKTASEVTASILKDRPLDITEANPSLPGGFDRILRRCLAKDPLERIQTARDVHHAVEDLKLDLERNAGSPAAARRYSGDEPAELSFKLTADMVRGLSARSPKMIGTSMTYLDNGVSSETLVILMHGTGGDQRNFRALLRRAPFHAVAPSLYGFDPGATFRPALPLDDHSVLLRHLFKHMRQGFRPARTILVGFSAGADHVFRMIAEEEGLGIDVDGVLNMGCNFALSNCFATKGFSELPLDKPETVLAFVRSLSDNLESLGAWVLMNKYMIRTIQKFGADMAALKRYSADIVEPFENDGDPFPAWYRATVERIPVVRLISSEDERREAEAMLDRHLRDRVLGENYSEDSFRIERLGHLDLGEPEFLLPQIESLIKAVGDSPNA